ncbi:hypothetical protein OESDEN_22245 [Oesophagostomum dentatum]|uniref:C2H2-type domain-containing protein n=1 Tax=Oesophagostomum dentatum TaxID=61180 RepID=A0A0B1S4N1_OESDE|nr:hypothetical protein OESDEN_22245 [Oesophagostomum dentatum]
MELKSNEDWRAHLNIVHGVSGNIIDAHNDVIDVLTSRSQAADHRFYKCTRCRRHFKSECRLAEHVTKFHNNMETPATKRPAENSTKQRGEVVVKQECLEEDISQAASAVKKEPSVEMLYEKENNDLKNKKTGGNATPAITVQPPREVVVKTEVIVKTEPPSPPPEHMFPEVPTSGHLLRQRLMQHRRALMEDEKNEMKVLREE